MIREGAKKDEIACNETIYNQFFGIDVGPFVRPFWKQKDFVTPKKCEDIELRVAYPKK